MPHAPYDEAALIRLLRSGNQKAFEQLYDRFAPSLLGILLKIVHDQTQAEDLLQDSFIKIWRHFPQYDPERGRLFTWMLRITRNLALSHLKESRLTSLCIDEVDPDLLGAVTPTYHAIGLASWVSSILDPHHRHLINLVYFQGYTRQEIADEFGLPIGTVKTHVRQAIRKLRNSESVTGLIPSM